MWDIDHLFVHQQSEITCKAEYINYVRLMECVPSFSSLDLGIDLVDYGGVCVESWLEVFLHSSR